MKNIKKLIKNIRYRLNDIGKYSKKDNFKHKQIFSNKQILVAIEVAWGYILFAAGKNLPLSFLDDLKNPEHINSLIQLGAVGELLLSQALIEKAREWNLKDTAVTVSFNLPNLSDMCLSQGLSERETFFKLLSNNLEELKLLLMDSNV